MLPFRCLLSQEGHPPNLKDARTQDCFIFRRSALAIRLSRFAARACLVCHKVLRYGLGFTGTGNVNDHIKAIGEVAAGDIKVLRNAITVVRVGVIVVAPHIPLVRAGEIAMAWRYSPCVPSGV